MEQMIEQITAGLIQQMKEQVPQQMMAVGENREDDRAADDTAQDRATDGANGREMMEPEMKLMEADERMRR